MKEKRQRLEAIKARKAELRNQLEKRDAGATDQAIDLNAVNTELDSLNAESEKLESEIKAEEEVRSKLANNDKEGAKVIDNPTKEQRKTMDPENILSTKEYRSAFLKNLQGKSLTEEETRALVEARTLTTGTSSAGAAVPTTTYNKIIEKLYQTNALFSKISVTEIPGNLSFSVSNAQTDAAWKNEGTDGTPGDDTETAVTLNGYELIKLVEISAASKAMTIDAFETYIAGQLSKKLSAAIENAILNGTGSAQPKGILTETLTAAPAFTKAGMVYKDITGILATLPTMYHANATLVVSRKTFFNEIIGMVDANKRPIVVADLTIAGANRILGYPVIINDRIDDDTILFGDFEYYRMNFSQAITIESDKSVGFKSGKITYRGMAVVDAKTALTEAFVKSARAAA